MPRRRLLIFHKVSNLLRIPIFVSKMSKKPLIPKLVSLKRSRKLKRAFKTLKHKKHFLEECEFSPSSTPLIHNYSRKMLGNNTSYKKYDLCSMLLLCRCLGGGLKADVGGDVDYRISLESLPSAIAGEYLQPLDYLGVDQEEEEEEDSVDQRAEKFIRKFYQDMRMQRQESI